MRWLAWAVGLGLCATVGWIGAEELAPKPAPLFEKKRPPKPGDWLHAYPERGQSLDHYRAARPVKARPNEVLAFLPVGPFDRDQRSVMELSTEFAGIWFQLPTRILDAKPLPKKWNRRRGSRVQYRTAYFLQHLLPNHRPSDAVSVQAVTMADLYPEESWNFVFGMANLRRRIGVWSFARFEAQWSGRTPTKLSRRKLLRRACQLVVHEIGHVFGLQHCIRYECTMNGSNSLPESDSQPLHLCPPCHRKLRWNRRWDTQKRLVGLRDFCRRHEMTAAHNWFVRRLDQLAQWKRDTAKAKQAKTK